jgi:hypothetical protein
MLDALQRFIESLPLLVQWIGVMLVGAIPFVESELASVVGIVAGVAPPVAIAAAIIGNIIAVWVLVSLTHAVRGKAVRSPKAPVSHRRQRVRRAFDKYGVAGVSLLGPFIVPSQITSVTMVSFGAMKRSVLFWQSVAITIWGVVFGVLALVGVELLANR